MVAESFARTFYRNCFEVGLPAIEVPGIKDLVNRGDVLPVDLTAGESVTTTTGARATGSPADPFPTCWRPTA
ncbi:hypothetical protein [Streptomyces sp. Inha503]|uniref:hypothetical protein n=1 Tax=Streptomyces sp. Inha503 TaxID=3383314 RepID=UPI00399F7C87